MRLSGKGKNQKKVDMTLVLVRDKILSSQAVGPSITLTNILYWKVKDDRTSRDVVLNVLTRSPSHLQLWEIMHNLCQIIANSWVIQTENKKLSYCWETVRRESMPRIAEMDVEMTT